jgi:membrane peptidoglycan carboxypeptidase
MYAWLVGFTPHVVTGVWVGFDQRSTIIANGYAAELAVPIWTSFMKVATKGDAPDWLERPDDVVGVTVCRASGKLPSDGCSNVQVDTGDGWVETRSMLYTEYFKKGTQPTTYCPIHSGYVDMVATRGASDSPRPVADEPAPHAPAAATSGRPAPGPEPAAPVVRPADPPREEVRPAEPKKKRGFWSKVFGIDKKDDKKDERKKDEKKKPGGG